MSASYNTPRYSFLVDGLSYEFFDGNGARIRIHDPASNEVVSDHLYTDASHGLLVYADLLARMERITGTPDGT